jgi:hypothetical protein
MKQTLLESKGVPHESPKAGAKTTGQAKIHPVVIYPFVHPADHSDLEELYRLVARLDSDRKKYARPVTVMDRKTYYAAQWNKQFAEFRANVVARYSQVLDAWCVDTCQMWYAGLGTACEQGNAEDVYWLIPGDFDYGAPVGKTVLRRLRKLPEAVLTQPQDFCIGEVTVDHNSSKQLIDTYGTYGLLYNWFPQEAQEIRKLTNRPRSEFFAIRHGFLREALAERWYAYEQSMVLLLQGIASKKPMGKLSLGDVSDLPQGTETLASAMQQVERTERVLKLIWRERNQTQADWVERFQTLEAGSEQIRRAALLVLKNLLR